MATLVDKEDIKKMIDALPDGATLEDLAYQIYFRQTIEDGLADADAGRVYDTSEVRAILGLRA